MQNRLIAPKQNGGTRSHHQQSRIVAAICVDTHKLAWPYKSSALEFNAKLICCFMGFSPRGTWMALDSRMSFDTQTK